MLKAARHITAFPHFDLIEVMLVTLWFKALQLCQRKPCKYTQAMDCFIFQPAIAWG